MHHAKTKLIDFEMKFRPWSNCGLNIVRNESKIFSRWIKNVYLILNSKPCRPWSDCVNAQALLGLRSNSHFCHDVTIITKLNSRWVKRPLQKIIFTIPLHRLFYISSLPLIISFYILVKIIFYAFTKYLPVPKIALSEYW